MISEQELNSLYDFLRATPEGHLKKMMVSGKMSEVHLRVLLKMVRGGSTADFVTNATAQSIPRMKMNAAEMAIKEDFWPIVMNTCTQLGLVSKVAKAA